MMNSNDIKTEQNAKSFLAHMVDKYKIFIDSCSLLSEYADSFWEHIIPMLKEKNSFVVVPFRVYEEVAKYADNPALYKEKAPDNPDFNKTAINVKKKIIKLANEKLVRVFGDKNDNFADNVFQTVFTQYRMKYDMLLITQDKNLSEDIMRITESKSVMVNKKILVKKINRYGYLSNIDNNQTEKNKRNSEIIQSIPENERFKVVDTITEIKGEITVTEQPKEGDILISKRGTLVKNIKLYEAISSGGEGTIYATNFVDGVAKIYKQGKIDKAKYKKIELMISKNLKCEGVCFPIASLFNKKGEFVGYLMKKAKGEILQKCLLTPQLLIKYFPDWKKLDVVKLSLTILKKIKYLHDRNIILGDINPNNILVVSPEEVYFVDTDSYQIEGYPCPVGTIRFTAPEIQRKRFDTFLRTIGNERFAVATLLFMIMLNGKSPYSLQGGESQIDNIINGDFPYAFGEKKNGKAPDGMWRYVWSHLSWEMKKAFYETFKKGEKYYAENNRLSDEEWIDSFERYAEILSDENGQFLTKDSMSAELFPTRLKKDANANYVKCKICGMEVYDKKTENGYCRECLKKGEIYKCKCCGKEMFYTNYQKYINKAPKRDLCHECNNSTYTSVRCSVCNSSFNITYGEKEYYDKNNLCLPKKCPTCRIQKRLLGYDGQRYSVQRTYVKPASTINKKSSLCFITSAACKCFNKADDCYELTTLRKFRDGWLMNQPDGKALVQEYYDIAPDIVNAIEASDEKEYVYTRLWLIYIMPCVRSIENGDYDYCKIRYVQMVNYLKEKYNVK